MRHIILITCNLTPGGVDCEKNCLRSQRPRLPSLHGASEVTMSSFGFPQLNPTRLRSYLLRTPICTRVIVAVILLFWIGGIWGGFAGWASLKPAAVFQGGGESVRVSGKALIKIFPIYR